MYFLTFEFRLLFDAINELTLIKVANEYFQKKVLQFVALLNFQLLFLQTIPHQNIPD